MISSSTTDKITASSYMEKPMPHYTTSEWHTNNDSLKEITDKRTELGHEVRQSGEDTRNAAENIVRWKLQDTNNRMRDRIIEVDGAFDNLEFCVTSVKDQIQRLGEAKVGVETAIPGLMNLQEATKDVMSLRDRRREIDLVEDGPYDQLKKEWKLIDKAGITFRKLSNDCFAHLLAMKSMKDKLAADLLRKEHALQIDQYKYSLTPESSANISYKPRPLELPKSTVSMANWAKNNKTLTTEAEAICVRTMQLTNDVWGTVKTMLDDIRKQREATQKALRKRHHDILQTRDKLADQRRELMNEYDKLEKEMKSIEKVIAEKTIPHLKLTETRLENRKWRRGTELVKDLPYEALKLEWNSARKAKDSLEQHLRDVKNNMNCVHHHLRQVEDDLERKERSLAIEKVCLDLHKKPSKAPYQTDLCWRALNMPLELEVIATMGDIAETITEPQDGNIIENPPAGLSEKANMTDELKEGQYFLDDT